jgi:hypothetical protein
MSNNKKSNSYFKKAKSLVESLGVKDLEFALENKEKEFGSLLHLNSETNLSTDKFIKPCSEDEDPYDTSPPQLPKIDLNPDNDGSFKKIDKNTLVANSGFGLIMPALSILDMAIFVPKQKKRKCFRKSRKKINKNSVENEDICYLSSQCKSKKCENNFFGLFEGNCVEKRPTVNIEEGGICASDQECNGDLYCNNWYIGLGKCKSKKQKK